ncbi:hypothetical protein GXP70_10045 [Paenibacillus lycopersici]|uniref:Helix-hairpin-helix DNA-binding motif class 1 domain-containing protein n=1 Tax=Paenibacillus lycopersici TaxID=2704462 RepID=A0A6C0FXP1_9BACL|nr:helix-hairpin-helix domain-containing protein [Paenibacillus lycopersici]QHT60251.1 hypothetical protein GXP70_10045 [Paenibacillus lycopersici]
MKRRIRRSSWSGSRLGAGACILVSILLIAIAMMQNGAQAKPGWTAMNEQVDRALAPLEQREANVPKETAGDKKKQPAASGQERDAEKRTAGSQAADKQADAKQAPNLKAEDMQAPAQQEAAGQAEVKQSDSASTATDGMAGDGAKPRQLGAESQQAGAASNEGKIDVNHASAAELDALPGIGAAKAEAIVADRERNGLFRNPDDLLRVKGIGPKLLDKMKSYIVLQP